MNQTEHDTVGAVAFDLHGNMAAGTSTGGITAKRVGRVGDSPLIEIGACCDNEIGGVSCTGHGEAIAKVTLVSRVLNTLKSDGCRSRGSLQEIIRVHEEQSVRIWWGHHDQF